MGKLLHTDNNFTTLNQYLLNINPACPSPIDTFANTLRARMTTTGVVEVIAKKRVLEHHGLCVRQCVCVRVCQCASVCMCACQCVCVTKLVGCHGNKRTCRIMLLLSNEPGSTP